MTRHAAEPTDLIEAVSDLGYTPRRADIERLIALVTTCDDELVAPITRALLRVAPDASKAALVAFDQSRRGPQSRERTVALSRVARLGGRIAGARSETRASWRLALTGALTDDEPRVVRAAANAVGRLGKDSDVERALLAALGSARSSAGADRPGRVDVEKSLVEALGKVGSNAAMQRLTTLVAATDEMRRVTEVATTRVGRDLARSTDVPPRVAAELRDPVETMLLCRRGLEEMLVSQPPKGFVPRVAGIGRVRGTFRGPVDALEGGVALGFAFVLAERSGFVPDETTIVDTIADGVASPAARRVLTALSSGVTTYRIEWANAGHRRALTRRAAAAIAASQPALRNDPRAAAWEIVIEDDRHSVRVLLVPRRVTGPRTHPRVASTQGASHPTIAAALARTADLRPNDVVWDPFVGSGTELVACLSIGGPRVTAHGTDIDASTLAVAAKNLEAAGLAARCRLACADAREYTPDPAPTLVITNPPMGRRLERTRNLGAMLERALTHASSVLRAGGRIVWLSPFPDRTARAAARLGLVTRVRRNVDLGGFEAELQRFDKPLR